MNDFCVLLVNYEYPPLGGGAGVATASLAEGLAGLGARVDVVTAQDLGQEDGQRVEHPADGLTLYRVKTSRKGIHQAGAVGAASFVLRATPLIRRLAREHDYHVAHLFFSLPTGALLPVGGLSSVPVVVSLRGSDVPGYDRYKPALQRLHRLFMPLTRWIWRRADRVVVVCESLGRLARRTEPGLDYRVIRNGVDLDLFRPPAVPRNRSTGPIRCVAVARLIRRKGLSQLLRAWSHLERGRFRLEIVGDGPAGESLRALTAELGLDDDVEFAGALDHTALAERYRAADLFTLVPFDEAFGNVFAEALASGLPIVGSRVGGIPELVSHGRNGLLVEPGDPLEIALAIRRLADDPELRLTMNARNRARAEATLSWAAMTDRYAELYRELSGQVPVGRELTKEPACPA